MMIEQVKTKSFLFTALPGLDPVRLYVDQIPGTDHGIKVTLVCWGDSWTTGFTSPGGDGFEFLARTTGPDYLANAMVNHQWCTNRTKLNQQDNYLQKIWKAIQPELRAWVEATPVEDRWK